MPWIPCGAPLKIPQECIEAIDVSVQKRLPSISENYQKERRMIVGDMRRADPRPHRSMFYADYPAKNGKRVDELARETATSDKVKKQLANDVKQDILPIVDASVEHMEPRSQKAVRTVLDRTVDKVVKKILNSMTFSNTPVVLDDRD